MEVEVHRLRGWGQNKWSFVKILSLRRETGQSLRERKRQWNWKRDYVCLMSIYVNIHPIRARDLRPQTFTVHNNHYCILQF